jgi:cytochrome c
MLKWVVAAGLVAALPAVASAQDAEAGKSVFNKCKACHSAEAGKNMVGPSLAGVAGRKAGEVAGFNYSEAMKGSGKTWDDAALDAYLTDPKGAIPGNKMVFVGIKDEGDRKNLIAYLKTLK